MNTDDSSTLIERYFLGTISAEDLERLDAQLQEDTSLRGDFAAMARLDANLRDTALKLGEEEAKPTARPFLWAAWTAAAAILLATIFLAWPPSPQHIAKIVDVGGSVRWSGNGGEITDSLTKGVVLRGGTLESLSADSWVEIALEDSSTMSLFGQSSMTLSQSDSESIIRLRRGSLSANVATVPERKPMQFLTPTAKAEVLGTQFTLKADSASTRLIVYEGKVRTTRLADGSSQDVPADHFVVASLDTDETFEMRPRKRYADTWQSTLPHGMGHGKWHPKHDGTVGYLEATPLLWKEYGQHMVLDLASLSAIDQDHRTALLKDGARLRIVGRLAEEALVHFGLTTHRVGGGFAGKYIVSKQLPGTEETFILDLGITSFERQYPCFPESPIGHELIDWWALTINHDAGLEIISIELLKP